MNIIPKEAALDMLKHSALKRTNDFAEYWFFSAPSVVVKPNDEAKALDAAWLIWPALPMTYARQSKKYHNTSTRILNR